MSKLSFRARALDASKPMPIYMAEDLPDLPDYSAINRAVPQMPSGMEKEEECEHHLQRAICTGLIIPTPEVADMADAEAYDKIYPNDAKLPRQLIHMQPFAMEQDIPDYDMDSEDEVWVSLQAKKMDLDELKFEEMMDRLEKGSGQTVVTLQEAKSLLKEDDDLIIAVYDYWLNKRLKTQHPLILTVKTEHRLGSAANNPYLAFRRRTEKMQTRKNRKNDETSYEKMLKLRRDLSRAVTLLELSKRREKTKRELVHLTIEVFEKRYQCADFNGSMLAEVSAIKVPRPAFAPLFTNQFGINHQNWPSKVKEDGVVRKEKRQYKKRKHKGTTASQRAASTAASYNHAAAGSHDMLSSDDEMEAAAAAVQSEEDLEPDPAEEPFAFRRRIDCSYHAPVSFNSSGNWPWCSRDEGGAADRKYRYSLTSVSKPRRRCVGLARRRVGRGGRIILDRANSPDDDLYSSLDFTVRETPPASSVVSELKNDWLHFHPRTPSPSAANSDSDNEASRPSLLSSLGPASTLAVDLFADDFAAASAEFNLYDFLAEPPTLDYQLGGNYLDDNPVLERLGGHVKVEPDCDDVRRDGSTRGKVGYSEFGCSTFSTRPRRPPDDDAGRTGPRRQQCSVSDYVAATTNCADHAYSNGLTKREQVDERLAWGAGLTNGPALPEYPGTSRSRVVANTSNCFSPSGSPPGQIRASPGHHRPSSVSGGNYVLTRGVTIVHEPGDEAVTVKSEPLDVDSPEKASNQVCVDKKQLVRKNNSLPMEVT